MSEVDIFLLFAIFSNSWTALLALVAMVLSFPGCGVADDVDTSQSAFEIIRHTGKRGIPRL